ncbi:MAG: hypothetical protein HQL22_05435 [Candidatus Omnitrophica bacterium]|nr:hypothetical protein [Candidatus Omnitrophota bacterium]
MSDPQAGKFLDLMFGFVKEAGSIALDLINSGQSDLKADSSVITQADLRISALAAEKLAPLMKSGGHAMIDEEDPRRGEYLDDRYLDEHPFIWSLDPIDGTRAYANRIPYYGVSIGLIKDRRPWLGVVYFPSLNEMFYCDGLAAYFVKDPFSAAETKFPIIPIDEKLTDRSVFIASDDVLFKYNWLQKDCRVIVLATAVCEFCWPAIGRGCGSLAKVHLWDLAGSWPIFEKAGLKLRSYKDGKLMDRLDVSSFERGATPWKFRDDYILSSDRNFLVLKERLVTR